MESSDAATSATDVSGSRKQVSQPSDGNQPEMVKLKNKIEKRKVIEVLADEERLVVETSCSSSSSSSSSSSFSTSSTSSPSSSSTAAKRVGVIRKLEGLSQSEGLKVPKAFASRRDVPGVLGPGDYCHAGPSGVGSSKPVNIEQSAEFLKYGIKVANLDETLANGDLKEAILNLNLVLIKDAISRYNIDGSKFLPENLSAEALANKGSIVLHEVHGLSCTEEGCCKFNTPDFYSKVISTADWEYSEMATRETLGEYYEGTWKKSQYNAPPKCGVVRPNTQPFYNDIDMVPTRGWLEQVQELRKLPPALCHGTPETDLMANATNVAGVRTYYYYLKLSDARTRAHRESVSLLSLNINIGPGSCTWYITPRNYTEAIRELLSKYQLDFDTPFWLKAHIFAKAGIPVIEVLQASGDAIIVGPGTWHCVMSNGPTVNVATNLAPLDIRQLRVSFDHYFYDRRTRTGIVVIGMISLAVVLAVRVRRLNLGLEMAKYLKQVLKGEFRSATQELTSWKKSVMTNFTRGKVDETGSFDQDFPLIELAAGGEGEEKKKRTIESFVEDANERLYTLHEWCVHCNKELWNTRVDDDGGRLSCQKCALELVLEARLDKKDWRYQEDGLFYVFEKDFMKALLKHLDSYIDSHRKRTPEQERRAKKGKDDRQVI